MGYNPGISYRGDLHISNGFRGLGRGIEQAGGAIGDAMKERKDEQKRINAGQSVYDKLMGTENPDYDPSAMSAREKYDAYNAMKEAAQYGMMVQQSEAQRLMNVQRENQMNAPPRPINTAGGLYDPASGSIIPGTGPQQNAAQLMGAPDVNKDGVPDQVVQQHGFYGTWDPKTGMYSGWKPMSQGDTIQAGGVTLKRGGADYSQVPQYSIESLMGGPGAPAPAPGAPKASPEIMKVFPDATSADVQEIQKRLDAGWTLEQLKAAIQ